MGMSSSSVDRAGQRLRSTESRDAAVRQDALDVLHEFRREHIGPLASATMGLRSALSSQGLDGQVSQRLKRVPTILDKLARLPDLRLSQVQDIGGCRTVLRDISELRVIQEHLTDSRTSRTRELKRVSDYVTEPRPSGYRAVHLIVAYQGRSIEVQLRTRAMHLWALHVERLSAEFDLDLKETNNPTIRAYLAGIAEAMAIEESGGRVDPRTIDEINTLRVSSMELLRGRRDG